MPKDVELLAFKDMTPQMARELLVRYGDATSAARAVLKRCVNSRGAPATLNTVRQWIQAAIRQIPHDILKSGANLNRLAELLERSGVDVSAIGDIKSVRLSSWGVHAKNPETGEIETKALYGTKLVLSPSWEQGPKWPLIDRPKPISVSYNGSRVPPKRGKVEVVCIIPDIQFGFLRDLGRPERLTPTHDPQALDIVLQLLEDIRPTQVGYLGDLLDLPEQSKYIQLEEFWRTTQPALDEAYKFLCKVQEITKPSRSKETFFVSGNHERRLEESILRCNRAAYGLRPAGSLPDSWPVLSVPYLLRFPELGIRHCGQYPGGEHWLADDLVVMHAPPSKKTHFLASVIHGHSHQLTRTTLPIHTQDGPKTFYQFDLGALCSIGRNTDPNSLLATGTPSGNPRHNWAQGLGLVYLAEGRYDVSQIAINSGVAIFNGKVYKSRV